jgi:hypothetical protein
MVDTGPINPRVRITTPEGYLTADGFRILQAIRSKIEGEGDNPGTDVLEQLIFMMTAKADPARDDPAPVIQSSPDKDETFFVSQLIGRLASVQKLITDFIDGEAYQPRDADLTAIAALTGTGIAVRTAADTWAQRTITGTANAITVTNGDGVAGNPTISLPAALTFTGKTITGGTYASGAFNGTIGATTPATGAFTTCTATTFTGSGSGLTSLNAGQLSTGTVLSARLAGSYTGITGTGALAAGSIAAGFGTIQTNNAISHQAYSATGATRGITLTSSANTGIIGVSTIQTTSQTMMNFANPNGVVGSISTSSTTTTYATTSDERLKENFRDFDAGSLIDGIHVYRFDWKAGGEGYGPKAQELARSFPLATVEGDDEKPWQYDPSKLVPLLIREVQALRGRVAALENAHH